MNLPLAPVVAGVIGVGLAAACALMPAAMLEGLVMDSGLPAVISAAEPPLGMTARLLVAAGAGGLVALFTWFGLFLILGSRGVTIGKAPQAGEAVPVLRRADAHPDAPARAPLLATRDLGTPFLEVTAPAKAEAESYKSEGVVPLFAPEPAAAAVPPAEQDLPIDLEQPLAAFDPQAIPDVPMPPPVSVSPLRPRPAVFDSSERFETFELTPMRRAAPPPRLRPAPRPEPRGQDEPIATPKTDATIHALLDRLEKGVVRRGLATGPEPEANPRETERGLEEALVALRNLARRA
ncbi:hypothetical protein OF829_17385 [Sphingomonas sp. LB-2]|uniref:hypothetical protein n=1 Tax=Sphingomonas caeni TaxID=2984949 RepID=UPI00222F219A|nr:hypothetical protein [Sphingomonas caeni]MCW3849015.1 hypothetical protein [Sphingomonas caeni]